MQNLFAKKYYTKPVDYVLIPADIVNIGWNFLKVSFSSNTHDCVTIKMKNYHRDTNDHIVILFKNSHIPHLRGSPAAYLYSILIGLVIFLLLSLIIKEHIYSKFLISLLPACILLLLTCIIPAIFGLKLFITSDYFWTLQVVLLALVSYLRCLRRCLGYLCSRIKAFWQWLKPVPHKCMVSFMFLLIAHSTSCLGLLVKFAKLIRTKKISMVETGLMIFVISSFVSFFDIFFDNTILTISSVIFFIGLGLFELQVLSRAYEKIPDSSQLTIKNRIKWVFLFFLLLVTISSLKFEFMKAITEFLEPVKTCLTIITIFFGFVTFYLNKEVVDEIEEEKAEEERKEEIRKKEFAFKFPIAKSNFNYGIKLAFYEGNFLKGFFRILILPLVFLARAPHRFVKWMYGEGWRYGVGLILIFMVFIFVRLYMFRFTGSYPDEYGHILSGINLFEHGTLPKLVTYTETWQYTRGAHISFLVGLFMFLFGKTLTVAKLVPITLGTLSFFMLRKISKDILKSKILQLVYLLVFTFCSWSIFNHFYIRGYVFTEFSIILMLFLGFKLVNYIRKNELIETGLIFFLMIIIASVNYYFSNDATSLIIPIVFFFQIIIIFFLEAYKKKNKLNLILKKLYSKKETKVGLFIFFLMLIGISLFNINFIDRLLHGSTNTGAKHIDFNEFFFKLNFIFSLLSIMSITILIFVKNRKGTLLIGTILPLLILHAISSKDRQIMRGMLYIFPFFFLSSFLILDKLSKIKPKLVTVIIALLIIFSFIPLLQVNYDILFDKGHPNIPSEIGYHEYSKQYDFMKQNLSNYTLFAAQYNIQKQEFFGLEYDYKLDFMNETNNHYSHYVDSSGVTRQLFTFTPVIKDFSKFKEIVENEKSCVALKPFSKKYFLGKEKYDYIISNMKLIDEEIGYKIYCN